MMRRRILTGLAAAMLAAAACGCASAPASQGTGPGTSSPATAPASAPATGPPAVRHRPGRAASLRVLTEPGSGIGPVYRLISGARSSIDLTMYELADPVAEADLAAAAGRGVDVRVLLDQHLEKDRNRSAYDYLAARGVHVRWAPAGTTYHQKTLTVDDDVSVIMTLNFVASDYPDTRDFAVIDTRRADVRAIVATFDADFAGRAVFPPDGTDLVWSPTNAQQAVLSIIGGATHTLAVETEEMDDPEVTSALAELAAAGVHIRLSPDNGGALYIHAKAIVADAGRRGQRVLVGSQNFSVASLDYNRELGILTSDRAVVSAIAATLASDFASAEPYSAAPASSPAGPGPARAWCRATASVYNAYDDENNVYVHSNQPYRTATASAGGYSHSYPTNGSGYAEIYLNGPAPGARITVTVGGATCTTSD